MPWPQNRGTAVIRRGIRAAFAVAVLAALLAAALPAAAGTGIGAIFNLGRTNTVNRATALTGTTASRMLTITNRGTGPALGLVTRAGVAPMTVSSTAKVANLNADLLDGLHASDFARAGAEAFGSYTCLAADLVSPTDGAAAGISNDIRHTVAAGPGALTCALHLPDGAVPVSVTFTVYDGLDSGEVLYCVVQHHAGPLSLAVAAWHTFSTGVAEMPELVTGTEAIGVQPPAAGAASAYTATCVVSTGDHYLGVYAIEVGYKIPAG
jgi:hypothetical protein